MGAKRFISDIWIVSETVNSIRSRNLFIEDDTCFDRILNLLEILCHDQYYQDVINMMNEEEYETSIFSSCKHIIANVMEYQPSSSAFAVKLLPVLTSKNIMDKLSDDRVVAWKDCMKVLLKVDIGEDQFHPSFQYAWVSSFSRFVSNPYSLPTILEIGVNLGQICKLTKSSSIFVERKAYLAISNLILNLQLGLIVNPSMLSSSLTKHSTEILESVGSFLISSFPLNTTLKVMTEVLKLDFNCASAFFKVYLNKPSPFFERKAVKEEIRLKSQRSDPILANFIHSITSVPIWLSTDFVHEIAVSTLLNCPSKVTSYTMLGCIAVILTEKTSLYLRLVVAPFQVTLGKIEEEDDLETLAAWKQVLDTFLVKSTHISTALCNSANVWLKMWKSDLLNENDEKRGFQYFNEALKCIYELTGQLPLNVRPALLQNWKVSLAILDCVKSCVEKSERCFLCVHEEISSTVQLVMQHADSDHQVMKKCGLILLSLYTTRCHQHIDSMSLATMISCLIEKLGHLRWQERDTSCELLSLCLKTVGSRNVVAETKLESLFISDVFPCLLSRMNDSNSYVRSTAVLVAKDLVETTEFCAIEQLGELLSTSVNILQNDEEAYPRRSAVLLASSCLFKRNEVFLLFANCFISGNEKCSSPLPKSGTTKEIRDILITASNTFTEHVFCDFDWEVKRNSVTFLSNFYDETLKILASEHDALKKKVSSSICAHLAALQSSFDEAVSECACDALARIKNVYNPEIKKWRKTESLLAELSSLLNDVEYRLTCRVPTFSHNMDVASADDVTRDCY